MISLSGGQLAKEDPTLSSPAVVPSLVLKTPQGQVGKHPMAEIWGNPRLGGRDGVVEEDSQVTIGSSDASLGQRGHLGSVSSLHL